MITTTLRRIRAHGPCGIDPRQRPLIGYQQLKAGLGPDWDADDPIPFARIIEINGLYDAVWCCRAEPQYAPEWRLFAVWCCRRVEHLMVDKRSRDALNVSERYANGQATATELADAHMAADEVGHVFDEVFAEWAARAAAWAAWAAPGSAAYAVEAAMAYVAGAADDELAAQTAEFLRIVTETEART